MSKKMRAGVIGCGAIAERLHVPDYSICPEVELVAFADALRPKAQALADRFAPRAKVFADYKKMLKEVELDCVTVTLPNVYHAPVTLDCLRAGCHVLVEKPMATSMAEARQMVAAAKKAKKLLMVNQTQRLAPLHVKAKEVMDSGIMGRILHVSGMFGHAGPEHWSPTGKWFFQKNKARFGAMADLGVHKADLIRFLTGKEIGSIAAHMVCVEKKGATVEDNFTSSFTFKDGGIGTLSASWTVKGAEANYVILYCENGTLEVGVHPDRPLVAHLVKPVSTIVFQVPELATNDDVSWGLDVSGHFVRACLKKEKPFCSGEEGMRSLEVVLAAEKSALTGKTIKL